MKYWVTVVAIFLLLNNVNSKDVRHTSKCSHALTNQKGTFSTPQLLSQPGYYPDNTHCKWNITVPRDGNVTITFTNFDTEACCDHVIITNEKGKLIGQYSGPKSTFDITLTYDQAHRVDIVFKSDESLYKAGFHAHYVIHGQPKPASLVKPTTAVPLVQPVGEGDSLMEAFLKMSSALTRIINSILDSSGFANSKQDQTLKSEMYQALQSIGTLNSVKTSALTKDENEQINVALKYLNLRAKAVITKLRPKLSPAVCKLPKVAGPCRAAFKRFYYNGKRCALFYYGGCQGNANNFGSKKSCEKLCEYQMCPDGIPVFNCFVNPCHERSCSAYMTTDRCEDNYCGGCNAVYYDQHNLVIPNDRCHCPLNETTVDCAIDPCQHASCPSYPNAKCRSRRCNKCTAEFVFANSTIVENC